MRQPVNVRQPLKQSPHNAVVCWPDAVRPSPEVRIRQIAGYRPDIYYNPMNNRRLPALAVAADRSVIFELFLALLEPLGPTVDVILETSHFRTDGKHRDYRRLGVDRAVLSSYLCEFEDVITDDGCTGVAVISPRGPLEVQFDEHKTIVVFAPRRRRFRNICRRFGLHRCDDLVLVSEVRHVHRSNPEFAMMFRDLTVRLAMTRDKY
jgi:hypothetical protein